MKRLSVNLIVMVGCFVVGLVVVSILNFMQPHPKANSYSGTVPQTVTPSCKVIQEQTALSKSRIRQIDFLNFIYPNKSSGYSSIQSTIKLVNGDFEFYNPKESFLWLVSAEQRNITYADLTGDGEEEAIIELFSHSGAAGGEHFIYIYTMVGSHPQLIWFFETYGSGTDVGGIKNEYVQDGDFILELYGENKLSESRATVNEMAEGYECDRCYKEFTRVRFHWSGKRFEQKEITLCPIRLRGAN
jgi:hypothetical protein